MSHQTTLLPHLRTFKGHITSSMCLVLLIFSMGLSGRVSAWTTTLKFTGYNNLTSQCNTTGSTSFSYDHYINFSELCNQGLILNALAVTNIVVTIKKDGVTMNPTPLGLGPGHVQLEFSPGASVANILHIFGDIPIPHTGTPGSRADWTVELSYHYNCGSSNPAFFCPSTNSIRTYQPPNNPVTTSATNIYCNTFRANWNAIPNATNYSLEVATSNFSNIIATYNNINGTYYDVPNLNMSTPYFYRVRANHPCGTTGYSQVMAVTTSGLLAAPVPTFNPNGCNITVNWSEVAGATGYRLRVEDGATLISEQDITTTYAVINNLQPGKSYTFKLAVYSGTGNTCLGSYTTANYTLQPMAAPSGVSHNSVTCSSVTLSWNSIKTLFHVQVATNNTFQNPIYDNDVSLNISPISLTINNLLPSTTYYYRVSAKNNATCEGSFSPAGTFTTPLLAAPSVSASNPGDITCNGFTANWASVSGATGYLLDVSTNIGFNSFLNGLEGLPVTGTSHQITSLTPGTTYYYRVRSVNSSCTSLSSNPKPATTLALPTTPLVVVQPSSITCASALIQWAHVLNSTYKLLVWHTPASPVYVLNQTIAAPALSYQVTGLSPTTTYYFSLTATVGPSACSSEASGSFSTTVFPAAPASMSFSQTSCNTGTINWGTSAGAATYRVQVSASSNFSPLLVDQVTSGISYLFNGTPGNSYYYRISSANGSSCQSGFSAASQFSLALPVPPTSLQVSQASCNQAIVQWNSANYSSFRIQLSANPAFTAPLIADQVVSGFTHTFTQLEPLKAYYFRIASREGTNCEGIFGSPVTFTTPSGDATLNVLSGAILNTTNNYYEACSPVNTEFGGVGNCVNRWRIEVEYYSDNSFSNRTNMNNTDFEWVSPQQSSSYNGSVDMQGISHFIIANGGKVYPDNHILEPGNFYKVKLYSGYHNGTSTNWYNTQEVALGVCLFSINGYDGTGPLQICQGIPLVIASATNIPTFTVDIVETDDTGVPTGPVVNLGNLTQHDLNAGFDLTQRLNGYVLNPLSYYKITLSSIPAGLASHKLIRIMPAELKVIINGEANPPLVLCSDESARLKMSLSTCVSDYYLYLREADANFQNTGPRLGGVLSRGDIDHFGGLEEFDLNAYALSLGIPLLPGYYNIIIGADYPYTESTYGIQVLPAVSVFTLNGQTTSPLQVCPGAAIVLDGSASTCHADNYLLGIASCDASGNVTSPWKQNVLSSPVNQINIQTFASSLGVTLLPGNYYKLEWGVGNPMVYSYKVLFIRNNTLVADAGGDLVACTGTISIQLFGNTPSTGTGVWSIVSGGTGTFANMNSGNTMFTGVAGNVYELQWTINSPCATQTSDRVKVYFNAVAYTNGNDAYWKERCYSFRPICVYGRTYLWNAVIEQYELSDRYSSNNSILLPHHNPQYPPGAIDRTALKGWETNDGNNNNIYYNWGWDNYTLKDWADAQSPVVALPPAYFYPSASRHIWDEDHLFVSPDIKNVNPSVPNFNSSGIYSSSVGLNQPMNLPMMLDASGTSNSYNIYSNPVYAVSPGAGFYMSGTAAIINAGNIDLHTANEYIMQQNTNNGLCAAVWGKGWRLPTKTEVYSREFDPTNNFVDLAYTASSWWGPPHQYFLKPMLTSSSENLGVNRIWTVAPGFNPNMVQTELFDWTKEYRVKCVFNTHYGCPNPNDPNETGKIYIPSDKPITDEDNQGIAHTETRFLRGTPTSQEEIRAPFRFNLWPNPAQHNVTISIETAGTYQVELYDMQGKKVFSMEVQEKGSIPLEELKAGIYLVRIIGVDGEVAGSSKLVKQ